MKAIHKKYLTYTQNKKYIEYFFIYSTFFNNTNYFFNINSQLCIIDERV